MPDSQLCCCNMRRGEWTLRKTCVLAGNATVGMYGVEIETPQVQLLDSSSARECNVCHTSSEEFLRIAEISVRGVHGCWNVLEAKA